MAGHRQSRQPDRKHVRGADAHRQSRRTCRVQTDQFGLAACRRPVDRAGAIRRLQGVHADGLLSGARKLRDLTATGVDRWLSQMAKTLSTRTLRILHSCLNSQSTVPWRATWRSATSLAYVPSRRDVRDVGRKHSPWPRPKACSAQPKARGCTATSPVAAHRGTPGRTAGTDLGRRQPDRRPQR